MPVQTVLFPDSYDDARRHFIERLDRLGISSDRRRHYLHNGKTPDGSELSTDTAWLGDPDASRVLVLISATHGIEGYAGSAVQFDVLDNYNSDTLPADCAMLLIHALNAWGYAWHRRCDAEGIDLNRNFIDFSQPLPENPGYLELREALLNQDSATRQKTITDYRHEHGDTACDIAVSGGQYVDAQGPFYGGQHPARSRRIIESLIDDYALAQRQIGVIDLHTGLGEYAAGEIICDHPVNSAGEATAIRWYGDEVALPELGTSSSVPKLGLLDFAWHAIMDDYSCYITLEYGTLPTDNLFNVLLDDHRFHAQHGSRAFTHPDYLTQVAAMRAHFCPDDNAWRTAVIERARDVIARAKAGLCNKTNAGAA